jgi:predicted outer membrane repeat protein
VEQLMGESAAISQLIMWVSTTTLLRLELWHSGRAAIWSSLIVIHWQLCRCCYCCVRCNDNVLSAGGISALSDGSKVVIKNSEFTGNKGVYGGAVATTFTETLIEGSKFINNTSQKFGGGLYVDGGSRPIDARYLPAGASVGTGPGRNVIVRTSLFDGNKATGYGGVARNLGI